MSLPSQAYPGLSLGSSHKFLAGSGTHSQNNSIVASIPGTPNLTPAARNSQNALPTLSIIPKSQTLRSPLSRSVVRTSALPTVGSTVLARVTRLEKARVSVAILVVDNQTQTQKQLQPQVPAQESGATASTGEVIADALSGVIRREDIRGWEIDKVTVADAFRVGDIVRAVVISIGDQAAYYLSTARNELGVLMARSEGGSVMVPVSWKEFRDPKTGRAERRKVAKPV